VAQALAMKRTPLILTERKEQALRLAERLKDACPNVIIPTAQIIDSRGIPKAWLM